MSTGRTLEFKKRFGAPQVLKEQQARVGDVATLQVQGRCIEYLITKKNFSDKPTMIKLERELLSMRDQATRNEITEIGMPAIGTGLDQLRLVEVDEIFRRAYDRSEVLITV